MGNKNKHKSVAHSKKRTHHKESSHHTAKKHSKQGSRKTHHKEKHKNVSHQDEEWRFGDKIDLIEQDDIDTENYKVKESEESLRYIYDIDNDEDKMKDMSKLEIMKTPVVRRILVATLLVLIAIAAGLAGTLILNNPLNDGQENALTFDITTDNKEIISGQLAEITIPYNNPSSVPLADVEMVLHIPDSFVLSRTLPDTVSTNPYTWKIGSLGPNERGEILIEGTFYEPPGKAITIQAVSRYMPANFSSPFEDIETESVLIEKSIFTTSVDGPARAVPGEEQEYTITVEHSDKERTVENVELRLELPTGFTIESSTLEPSKDNQAIWNVSIEPEETVQFKIKGTFASDIQGDQEISAIAGVNINDNFVEQTRSVFSTSVLASDFSLSLVVNGQIGDTIVLPKDDIIINVALDNRGEEAAEDMTIELFVDEGLDRVNLEGRSGAPSGDIYNNKINWDKTDVNRLETLRGGEEASIDLAIPTRDSGVTTVRLRAEATIKSIGDLEVERKLVSSTVTIRIASDIQATANAYYYDATGAIAGNGPLPPEVGQQTTYRVTWTVANALNDVEDLVMIAPIPSDATWAGLVSVDSGSVHYDSVSNRIRWSVGDLPAGASPPIAVFDMKSTPTSADIGTFLDLIGPATITAFDTTTNAQVNTSAPALTSELPNDPLAENKGIVIE